MAQTIRDDVMAIYEVEPDWKRFASVVTARRSEMGLTQEQVAAMGGPSTASMRLIESSGQDNYRQQTLFSLDRALGWSPGSHRGVLAGREPTVLISADEFRSKIVRPDLSKDVSGSIQDGTVYMKRAESINREALNELRRSLDLMARGIEGAKRATDGLLNDDDERGYDE